MTLSSFSSFSELMETLQTLATRLQSHLLPPGFPQDPPESTTNILPTTKCHKAPLMSKPQVQGGSSQVLSQRLKWPLASKAGATEKNHRIAEVGKDLQDNQVQPPAKYYHAH